MADSISRLNEPGQIARFVSLLHEWHGGPHFCPDFFWLPNHMSNDSIYYLSPQVKRWQEQYNSWIRKYHNGVP